MPIMQVNELRHYGVLGMKWGIRRTPEQLGRRTIPKGTVMYRATVNKDETTSGNKYVTYLEPDRDLYRGGYANILRKNAGKTKNDPVYENTYVLKEDLKLPSRAEVQSVIEDLRKKDKSNSMLVENGQSFVKHFIRPGSWEEYEMADSYFVKKYNRNAETDKDWEKAKSEMRIETAKNYVKTHMNDSAEDYFHQTTRSFGTSEKNRNKVIDELKKRGYNAMVDEAGVGSNKTGREGVDPLIIFDGGSALTKTSTVEIDTKTQSNAQKKHDQWFKIANSNKNKGAW